MHVACFFCERYVPIERTGQANLMRVGIGGFKRRTPPVQATLAIVATFALGEDQGQACELVHVGPDGNEEVVVRFSIGAGGRELQAWIAAEMLIDFEVGPQQIDVRAKGRTLCSVPFRVEE